MDNSKNIELISSLICLAANKNLLKKAIFSKSVSKDIIKSVATLKKLGEKNVIQIETFTADNKALHKNIPVDDTAGQELSGIAFGFMQINLITSAGECEYRCSKSGNSTVIGAQKLEASLSSHGEYTGPLSDNNKKKDYILNGDEPFLKLLGICDQNGRIHDKRQSKFRQINRFLEHIRDILKYLPKDEIRICDLCCGKSYLSFAVYHYFANVLNMKVSMTGVDLKKDVIDYCSEIAAKLGFDGLEFICADIRTYTSDVEPELVISLHACDTATDIVLEKAMEWNTSVILSTPCCHHELNHKLNCPELEFIAKYSMLRQKLCDAATDAMRLKLLESKGYTTDALELIDPEDTPKNIMLRAIKRRSKNDSADKKAADEYQRIRKFLLGEEPQ
jgi:hypothetical protein